MAGMPVITWIIIDQDAKTMTIQSERETVDMVYDLSEEETAY